MDCLLHCLQAKLHVLTCVQAPVAFKLSKPTGQPGYMVTIHNKHWFITTEGLVFDFRVMADGVPIKQDGDDGWTHFDIAQIPAQVYFVWAVSICWPGRKLSLALCVQLKQQCCRA